MKTYIGTKIVNGEPMTDVAFQMNVKKANRDVIESMEKEGTKDGYLVEYEDGYLSWSPKDVFERCYREISDKEFEVIGKLHKIS